MSYKNLSPNFHVFTSQVSCMEIPKSVQDALKIPEWKEVVFLENEGSWKKQDMGDGGFAYREDNYGV